MQIRIGSEHGRFRLFIGTEVGKPASRSLGKSPEWITIRCEGQEAERHCAGSSDKNSDFGADDCLLLALDSRDQELVLSRDEICRRLDAGRKWHLQLDLSSGDRVCTATSVGRGAVPSARQVCGRDRRGFDHAGAFQPPCFRLRSQDLWPGA